MEFTGERFIPGQGGAIELEHLNRYYFVVNQIDLTGKTVLDIASGEGYGSNILSKYANEVIGVDICPEAIDYSKNKYKAKNLRFIVGSAFDIPLEEQSVDVVVSFETIEHHDKHVEMLSELKRVLKPNGALVISSPDKGHFKDFNENKFHIKELYSKEFKDLIKQYFKYTFFYSQRVFSGSIIALDQTNNDYEKPLVIDKNGIGSILSPVYNIAIGTDNINLRPDNLIIIYKEADEILTQTDFENAINSIRNKNAYKLGKFILRPFSIIRRLFKKIYH